MFYSHTFLARKGPLGTVWCAAHLEKRIKKADCNRTNICETVDYIMFPEVPIALRMYGHLLLGVVRIYSRKVHYYCEECIHLRERVKKSFSCANVSLHEAATQAPYNSITVPETFQLDAFESHDDWHKERFVDTHLKPQEEITLEDQVQIGDQYVAIFIDEEMSSSTEENVSESHATPVNKDSRPSVAEGTSADPRPSVAEGTSADPRQSPTQIGLNERAEQEGVDQEFAETEVIRDASHNADFVSDPLLPDRRDDVLEPDLFLAEQVMKDQNLSPVVEETFPSGRNSTPSQPQEHPSASPEDGHGLIGSHTSFDLALKSTSRAPSPPPEQPRPRQRKRKLQMDVKSLVLSNEVIQAGLNDTSDLKRSRKKALPPSFGIWRSNKRLKKDAMFFEPLLTGQCEDLSQMHEQDFTFAKAYPPLPEEPHEQGSPAQGHDDMETEQIRDNAGPSNSNVLHEVLNTQNTLISSPVTPRHSSDRQERVTPATTPLGSQSDQAKRTIGSGVLSTPDQAAHSEMDTPFTNMEEDLHFQTTALSDIPEFENSAGDLSFLEQDDNSPRGSQGTPVGLSGKQRGTSEIGSLSTRSRAVAQYLKLQSSATSAAEGASSSATPVTGPGELSLNEVLQGKTRKICARMFFETLVLKNCELIDVKQEKPYGDVTLKATSKLMKEQL